MLVNTFVTFTLLAASATALPQIDARANTSVNPAAVTGTQCLDSSVYVS